MFILRPYQNHAAEAVLREFATVGSTLVVLPTGLGKTVLFADIIRRMFPARAMVLAHREELIFQAEDKIRRVTGLSTGVEMAEMHVDEGPSLFSGPQVIISSIQTQSTGGDGGGRKTKFDPRHFGLVVIDECHHAPAASFRQVLAYYRQNPRLRVLGVTATPDRADEQALGQVFDSVAYQYGLLDAIHDGWLVPIEQQLVSVDGLDFSNIRTTAGDLNGADLAEVLEREEMLHRMAGPSLEIIGNRRALMFCSSVKQAEWMAEVFNRHRSGSAAFVCGTTLKEKRRELLKRFADGNVQIVCNCGVLTEGFDDPGVEIVIMGRPTKSRALYAQCVGRATRPLPGVVDGPETPELRRVAIAASRKPSCLVVDFVGVCGRHKLLTSADILGGKTADEATTRALTKARKTGQPVRMDEEMEAQRQAIREEIEAKQREEAARRLRITAVANYKTTAIDPFDVFQITPMRASTWDNSRKLSEKQTAILAKNGIAVAGLPYSQAKQLLNEVFHRQAAGLCSFKQAKFLQSHGLPADLPRAAARAAFDAIAKNGWRVPENIHELIQKAQGAQHEPIEPSF